MQGVERAGAGQLGDVGRDLTRDRLQLHDPSIATSSTNAALAAPASRASSSRARLRLRPPVVGHPQQLAAFRAIEVRRRVLLELANADAGHVVTL